MGWGRIGPRVTGQTEPAWPSEGRPPYLMAEVAQFRWEKMLATQMHAESSFLFGNAKTTDVCSLWPTARCQSPHKAGGSRLTSLPSKLGCPPAGLRFTHTSKLSALAIKR